MSDSEIDVHTSRDKELRGAEIYDDIVELREIFIILWAGRALISTVAGFAAICSLLFAFWLPNIYESKALLSPREDDSVSGLGALARQYGGLASLAGINLGGVGGDSNRSMLAQEKIKSLDFFSRHLYEEVLLDLMAIEYWSEESGLTIYDSDIFDVQKKVWVREVDYPQKIKPSAQEAHEEFLDLLKVVEDKQSGLVTVSVAHQSPLVAKRWVDLIVESVTEEIRNDDIEEAEQSIEFLEQKRSETALVSLDEVFAQLIEEQTKTIMLAQVSKDYVFDVIDPPVVPEFESEPSRAVILSVGTILGVLLAAGFVITRHFARGGLSGHLI